MNLIRINIVEDGTKCSLHGRGITDRVQAAVEINGAYGKYTNYLLSEIIRDLDFICDMNRVC